jgi:intraflagellar transport protein 140
MQAIQVVESTNDRAAAYQLARHFENVDRIEEAIKFYSRSGCFSNAIRLAKEHNLKQMMLGLALRSTKADMIEVSMSCAFCVESHHFQAAEYYESQNAADKAVTLYHKGGRVSKALDLCFKYRLFSQLAQIAEDLDQDADPALLEKAAKFFNENNQKVANQL